MLILLRFKKKLQVYIPDAFRNGAKIVLGLEKQHNIVISADPHTLALLTLMHREEIGLTQEEADQVKKKLLEYILSPKESQTNQLPVATPPTE